MAELIQDLAVPDLATQDLALPDLTQVDRAYREMSAVEQSWSLPALPDNVKLDLLTIPEIASGVKEFLYGLEADLNEQIQPRTRSLVAPGAQAAADAQMLQPTERELQAVNQPASPLQVQKAALFLPEDDPANELRRLFSGLAGLDAPEVIATDAVADLKARAVGAGLLPPGTPIDNQWTPELASVRWDLMEEDWRRRVGGDRPGAISPSTVLDILDKWTSPSGLLAAAAAADFIPDFKAVKREASGWGDKWRKFWKTKSPRDFIDAVTGPIDDLAFPIINTALLFTGIGTMPTFVRGMSLVRKADAFLDVARAEAIIDAAGLAKGGFQFAGRTFGAVSAADLANDVYRMARSSIMATRLQRSTFAGARAFGRGMDAWRRTSAVMTAKKLVQQGMKLGFIAQLEALATPDRNPGIGFFGNREEGFRYTIDQYQQFRSYNPMATPFLMVAEMGLSPYSIFKPGTFSGQRWISKADQLSDHFRKVTEDPMFTGEFLAGAIQYAKDNDPALLRKIEAVMKGEWHDLDPGLRDALEESAKTVGRRLLPGTSPALSPEHAALLMILGNGNAEVAGWVATYLGFSVAVDKAARLGAIAVTGTTEGERFRDAYLKFRNHYINRVREVDDILDENGELIPEAVLDYIGVRSGVDTVDSGIIKQGVNPADLEAGGGALTREREAIRKRLFDEFHSEDPAVRQAAIDRARAEIEKHNNLRKATLNEVFELLEPGDIAAYMQDRDVWETLANWHTYTTNLDLLEETVGFTPDVVKLRSTHAIRREELLPSMRADAEARSFMQHIADEVSGQLLPAHRVPDSWANEMQKKAVEGRFRLTLARVDAPTLQEAELLDAQIRYLQDLRRGLTLDSDDLEMAERFAESLDDFARSKGKLVRDLSDKELREWRRHIQDTAGQRVTLTPSDDRMKRFARAYREAARRGHHIRDGVTDLDNRLARINANAELWNRYRVPSTAVTLDEKLNRLRRERRYLAQAVEVDPELAERFRRSGYKVVVGTDFAMPSDLLDLHGPLGHIRVSSLRRHALGTFLTRHSNEVLVNLKERRFRTQLIHELSKLQERGVDLGRPIDLSSPNSLDIDEIVGALSGKRRQIIETALDALEDASREGLISAFSARVRHSGLPQSRWMMRDSFLDEVFSGLGFSPEAVKALKAAAAKANNIGMRYQGLQGIESFLIGNSWVRHAFKAIGWSEVGDDLTMYDRARGAVRRVFTGRDQQVAIDLWRNWRRAGTAAAAGVFGYVNTGDPKVAGLAAAGGALAPGLVNPRTVARAVGTTVAAQAAESAGMDRTDAALLGLTVGVGGVAAVRRFNPARPGGLLDKVGWAEYSRLGKAAALARDRMRFALSPIFDLQRYTEGITLQATADLPDGVVLPITARPMRRAIRDTGWSKEEIMDLYDRVSNGHFELMESTQTRFRDVGIMNYSPHEWEAATVAQLVHQGMNPVEAFETARNIFTYGMKGRSAAELSVNFVFFPFSFNKKWMTQVGRFMASDLGRTVMIHNALKTWEVLYEEFDLGERWRDHLPLLDQLRKFNPLAYGMNLGELGGINRPFIDLALDTPVIGDVARNTMNFFLPQPLKIETEADANEVFRIARRFLPVWRDAEDLIEKLGRQNHVLFSSPTMRTKAAEVEEAYKEWNGIRRQVQIFARERNIPLRRIYNASPTSEFYAVRLWLDQKKAELMERYPAWQEALDRSVENAIQRNREIAAIVADPQAPEEFALVEFQAVVDAIEAQMRNEGLSLSSDFDALEPEVQNAVRKYAIQLAREIPEFIPLYRSYYERLFGPITKEIR